MTGNEVALATIALATTIVTGFFALITRQDKTHQKIANAMDKVATSNEKIANETKKVAQETSKGNKEAKERNGHLAELTVQQADRIIIETDKNSQHINKLEVENEVVTNQIVKNKE